MSQKRFSFESLQWLNYMQESCLALVDKNGDRVQIQHEYFRGEKSLGGFDLDGFALVDEKSLFFEFLGCFWHDGCTNEDCRNKNDRVDERWVRKRAFLESQGQLFYIRSCEWAAEKAEKKLWWYRTPQMPMVMKKSGTESDILTGIQDDQLFGFVVADVTTPDWLLRKILPCNFPPVITRQQITEEMLSQYMKQRVKGNS